jgi:pyruvate dehydrogenase (quinone)
VQIDIDASMLSIRFPMEVSLVGDAAETLRALLPRLDQKPAGEWRRTIEGNVRRLVENIGRPRRGNRRDLSTRSA